MAASPCSGGGELSTMLRVLPGAALAFIAAITVDGMSLSAAILVVLVEILVIRYLSKSVN